MKHQQLFREGLLLIGQLLFTMGKYTMETDEWAELVAGRVVTLVSGVQLRAVFH